MEASTYVQNVDAVWAVAIAVVTCMTAVLSSFVAIYRDVSPGLLAAFITALIVVAGALILGAIGAAFSLELIMVAAAPWILVVSLARCRRSHHNFSLQEH